MTPRRRSWRGPGRPRSFRRLVDELRADLLDVEALVEARHHRVKVERETMDQLPVVRRARASA